MILSTVIMHAPFDAWRRSNLITMKRALKAEGVDAHVVEDSGISKNAWAVARKAWKYCSVMTPHATHHLVLQDDLLLCRDFVGGAKAAIEALPDKALSLYGNRKDFEVAEREGRHWIGYKDPCWGQAVLIPADMTAKWLRWDNFFIKPEYPHDDVRLAAFLLNSNERMWCTAPSLVEHVGVEHSLLGHRTPVKNTARWYIGESSPLSIDWIGAVKNPIVTGGISWESFYQRNQGMFKLQPGYKP